MPTRTKTKSRTSKADNNRLPGAVPVSRVSQYRSFVLYGRSGTGKTTLAATFPGPVLLLDIKDEGTDSVSDVKDLDVREISEFGEIEDVYWWLKDHDAYRTVILDTMTQLQQLAVKEIIGDTGRRGKKAGDWGSMTQQDWGKVSGEMKNWITDFRDLAKETERNIVFIAQDRTFNMDDEDDSDNAIAPEVGPALSPAIAKHLNASVHFIGCTFIKERVEKKEVRGKKVRVEHKEYCVRVGPSAVYTTKVRKPRDIAAPDFIVNPTYDDILEVITGEQ